MYSYLQGFLGQPIDMLYGKTMIIKSKSKLPILSSGKLDELPVLPLRTDVLFPGMMVTIHVTRSENRRLIQRCLAKDKQLIGLNSPMRTAEGKEAPIHQVGVIAEIRNRKEEPSDLLIRKEFNSFVLTHKKVKGQKSIPQKAQIILHRATSSATQMETHGKFF